MYDKANARSLVIGLAALAWAVSCQAARAQDAGADTPRNWQETLNVMNGASAAGQAARTMHDDIQAQRQNDVVDKSSLAYRNSEASLDNTTNRHGVNAATLDAGYARDRDIGTLEQQLENASDETDVAIVNARAQLANSKMLNEMIKLQSANGVFDSQRDAQAEESLRAEYSHEEVISK
jgi:hypothetical protein